MKKNKILAFAFLGLIACQNSEQKLSDQDITAIQSTSDKYVSTALASDWDSWGNTITPDVIFSPPNQEPLVGREAAVAYVRTIPKFISFTAPTSEISGYKDLAYSFGSYSLTVTSNDSSSFSDQGSYVNIFRKQPDGAWLYSRVIWHSDLPLPTPKTAN